MTPDHAAVAIPGRAAVRVATSPIHGRGVFAVRDIATGDEIEWCPVIRVPAAQRAHLDQTLLFEYYFEWGEEAGVALGFGSLYNHEDDANAQYRKLLADDAVLITARRPIAAGEEITINYGGATDSGSEPLMSAR